jgi:hypothetical protein
VGKNTDNGGEHEVNCGDSHFVTHHQEVAVASGALTVYQALFAEFVNSHSLNP